MNTAFFIDPRQDPKPLTPLEDAVRTLRVFAFVSEQEWDGETSIGIMKEYRKSVMECLERIDTFGKL